MSLQSSVSPLHPDSVAAARRILAGATLIIGLAALTLGSPLALADDADEVAQTRALDSGSDQLSERQRRREDRRQSREDRRQSREAQSPDAAAPQPSEDEPSASEFVVAVEPEMECRRVPVTGSRVPKEVCTPVGLAAQEEHNAQEFLRRTQELQTLISDEERNEQYHPSAF